MKLWAILLFFAAFIWGAPVYAQSSECDRVHGNSSVTATINKVFGGGGAICKCGGRFISTMVNCFAGIETDANGNITHKGVVLRSVDVIYNGGLRAYATGLTGAAALLALLMYAYKLIFGAYQGLMRETFLTVFKIAGVLTFFSLFTKLHEGVIKTTGWMARFVVDAGNNAAGGVGKICPASANGSPNIWSEWDCMLEMLLGGFNNELLTGLVGFLISFVFSWGLGNVIFVVGTQMLGMLLLTAMRAVFTYLNAVIAISLLLLLAPIFVPLLMFKATWQWFQKWLIMLLGFPMQIMLLYLMMLLSLTALKYTIFVGRDSLSGVISNSAPGNPMPVLYNMLMNAAGDLTVLLPGSTPPPDLSKNMGQQSNKVGEATTVDSATQPPQNNTGTGKGAMPNVPQVDPNAQIPNNDPNAKKPLEIFTVGMDFQGMLNGLNGKLGAVISYFTIDSWLFEVVLRLIACSLLLFVVWSAISAVPKVSHDLVAHTFNRGNVTKSAMLGQSVVRGSMAAGKQAVRQAKHSPKQAKTTLKHAAESMVGLR